MRQAGSRGSCAAPQALLRWRGGAQWRGLVEVQGHTDNVGTDAYNQRLSEDRAAAVVAWLNQHQVKSDRLTSQGYGNTRPVADNNTDEGRARNRRVEIANTACRPKRP
jgi:OmpA-OmpF porin, OOP family